MMRRVSRRGAIVVAAAGAAALGLSSATELADRLGVPSPAAAAPLVPQVLPSSYDPAVDNWRQHVPTMIVPTLPFDERELVRLGDFCDRWRDQQGDDLDPLFTLGRSSGAAYLWCAPSRTETLLPTVVAMLDQHFGPRTFEVFQRVGRYQLGEMV